jgi:hypothetical protein
MTALAGLFLIAHGLVHVAVWLTPPPPKAPFDSHRSWLLGDIGFVSSMLAALACALFVIAGVLVLAGAGVGATLAVVGAAVSLVLVLLTFHPWFLFATVIDIAIIEIALR